MLRILNSFAQIAKDQSFSEFNHLHRAARPSPMALTLLNTTQQLCCVPFRKHHSGRKMAGKNISLGIFLPYIFLPKKTNREAGKAEAGSGLEPPLRRKRVSSLYLPACNFLAPGDPAGIAPVRESPCVLATRTGIKLQSESRPIRSR